jgi:hypothetical protein
MPFADVWPLIGAGAVLLAGGMKLLNSDTRRLRLQCYAADLSAAALTGDHGAMAQAIEKLSPAPVESPRRLARLRAPFADEPSRFDRAAQVRRVAAILS